VEGKTLKVGDFIYLKREGFGRDNTKKEFIGLWHKVEIVGETRVSWVLKSSRNKTVVNKRALAAGRVGGCVISIEEIEEKWWERKNRYSIARAVERASPDQLRAIAKIIGYVDRGDD
jgi:hypothetical protein